jgi:hypothetical protein
MKARRAPPRHMREAPCKGRSTPRDSAPSRFWKAFSDLRVYIQTNSPGFLYKQLHLLFCLIAAFITFFITALIILHYCRFYYFALLPLLYIFYIAAIII